VARGGVIGQGVTDGKQWRVAGSGSGKSAYIQVVGAIGDIGYLGVDPASISAPATVDMAGGLGDGRSITVYGTVSRQVTSVVLSLHDGERPSLTPVSWHGARWVAAVVPAGLPIVRAVAYAGASELAYSVPFRGFTFSTWFRPGQAGPARVIKSVGSGVVDGKPWHTTALFGPWGWCFSLGSGTECYGVDPAAELRGQPGMSMLTCSPAMGTAPASGIVFAASDIGRVVLGYSDGTSASFRVVEVARNRLFGYAIPAHVRVTNWREYGSRGQLLVSLHGTAVADAQPGWSCTG
jgi:hypothetical protein